MSQYISGIHRKMATWHKRAFMLTLLCCSSLFAGQKLSVFIQSTQGIAGSGGITLNSDGKTYITSSLPRNMRIFDPSLQKFVGNAFIQTPNYYSFFDDQVVYNIAGVNYVTGGSFLDGNLWTVKSSGQTIQSNQDTYIPAPGVGTIYNATFSPLLVGVDPITFRKSDGMLYVQSSFNPAQLFKVDPNGSAPVAINLSQQVFCNAFAFSPIDDKLYSPDLGNPDPTNNALVRIDVDSGQVTTIVTGIPSPIALKINSQGIIYFISRQTAELFKFDPATPNIAPVVIAKVEPALDNLALSADETKAYITNDQNVIFEVILSTGAQRKVFQSPILGPYDLAFESGSSAGTKDDVLWLADQGSVQQVSAKSGQLIKKLVIDSANSGIAGIGQANGISVEPTPNGIITVADITIGDFWTMDKNFHPIAQFSGFDTGLFGKQPFSVIRITGGTPAEYFLAVNAVDGIIMKIYKDGSNVVTETFFSGLQTPVKLKRYFDKHKNKDYIYIVEAGILDQAIPSTGRVSRIPLNNPVPAAQEILLDKLNNPQGLDIVDDVMYVVEVDNNRIISASALNTSTPQVVINSLQLDYPILMSQFTPKPVSITRTVAVTPKAKQIFFTQPLPNNISVLS